MCTWVNSGEGSKSSIAVGSGGTRFRVQMVHSPGCIDVRSLTILLCSDSGKVIP